MSDVVYLKDHLYYDGARDKICFTSDAPSFLIESVQSFYNGDYFSIAKVSTQHLFNLIVKVLDLLEINDDNVDSFSSENFDDFMSDEVHADVYYATVNRMNRYDLYCWAAKFCYYEDYMEVEKNSSSYYQEVRYAHALIAYVFASWERTIMSQFADELFRRIGDHLKGTD